MDIEIIVTDEMNDAITEFWDNCINEGVSGRLGCTTHGLNKIAFIVGLDYKIMGKEKGENSEVILLEATKWDL